MKSKKIAKKSSNKKSPTRKGRAAALKAWEARRLNQKMAFKQSPKRAKKSKR